MIAGFGRRASRLGKEKAGTKPGRWQKEQKGVLRRAQALDLSVSVGADFAVEVDLFVLRGGPFHGRLLWVRRAAKA